MMFILDSLENA